MLHDWNRYLAALLLLPPAPVPLSFQFAVLIFVAATSLAPFLARRDQSNKVWAVGIQMPKSSVSGCAGEEPFLDLPSWPCSFAEAIPNPLLVTPDFRLTPNPK